MKATVLMALPIGDDAIGLTVPDQKWRETVGRLAPPGSESPEPNCRPTAPTLCAHRAVTNARISRASTARGSAPR
jgi:hypothetical protein